MRKIFHSKARNKFKTIPSLFGGKGVYDILLEDYKQEPIDYWFILDLPNDVCIRLNNIEKIVHYDKDNMSFIYDPFFPNGYIIVQLRDGRQLPMDDRGELIFQKEISKCSPFVNGYAVINDSGIINSKGDILYEGPSGSYSIKDELLTLVNSEAKICLNLLSGQLVKTPSINFLLNKGKQSDVTSLLSYLSCDYIRKIEFRYACPTEHRFIIKKDGKFGIINDYGDVIAGCKYDSIKNAGGYYFIVNCANKYGVLYFDGHIELDCLYDDIRHFDTYNREGFKLRRGELTEEYLTYSTKDGITRNKTASRFPVSEPRKESKPLYYREDGRSAEDRDKYIYNAHDGLRVITNEIYFGYADSSGNLVIDCIYDSAEEFIDKHAKVRKGADIGYINTKGEFLLDLTQNISLPVQYLWGWKYDGVGIVVRDREDKYGLLDFDFQTILPCRHTRSEMDALMAAELRVSGDAVIDSVEAFHDLQTGLWGYKLSNGEFLFPCVCEKVEHPDDKLPFGTILNPHPLLVHFNGLVCFINEKGHIIPNMIYNYAKPFSEGTTLVNGYTYVDAKGEVVMDFSHDKSHYGGFEPFYQGKASYIYDPLIPGKDYDSVQHLYLDNARKEEDAR